MGDYDRALSIIRKVYGSSGVYVMSEIEEACDSAISLGIPAFDFGVLGIGGIPRGHFIEVYGKEKVGKTSIVLHMIAACQSAGLVPIVIDPKGSLSTDPARAARIGVDTNGVFRLPVETSEKALLGIRKLVSEFVSDNVQSVFFWDDMGLSPTNTMVGPVKRKRDGTLEASKVTPADKARVMFQFCRSLAGVCYENKIPMVVVNHLIYVIGSGSFGFGGPSMTTSGGGGVKYTARIRVKLSKGAFIKKGTDKIGQIVYAVTEANAFFNPFRTAMLHLDYVNGYDSKESTILNALKAGLIKKSRGKYKVVGSSGSASDLNHVDLWKLEEKMWPWMSDGVFSVSDPVSSDDVDSEEEGYVDWLDK